MKSLIFLLLFSLSLLSGSFAQLLPGKQRQIDSIFRDWRLSDGPGLALAIVQDGQIIYQKGYGMADLEHGAPITPTTPFYAGSVSKQFVATCIALLQEQGKLSLGDDVRKYIPELPDYGSTITIRHLLHHTSGLRDYFTLLDMMGREYLDHLPKQEILDLIFRQKGLNFRPGEQYSYSNSGYILLAEIIGRLSGKTLRQFADEHIFQPLGMSSSFFHDNRFQLIPNRAFSYQRGPDGQWINLFLRFDLVGSGGLFTTLQDLYKWDQNFYRNRLGLGRQSLIDTLQAKGIFNDGRENNYALAMSHSQYRGLPTISHTGSLAGYRAYYLRFPQERFSIIMLGNAAELGPVPKAQKVADLLLEGRFPPPSATASSPDEEEENSPPTLLSAEQRAALPGTYFSEELQVTYHIRLQDGKLFMQPGYGPEISLDRLLETGQARIGLLYEGKRKAFSGFLLDGGSVKGVLFVQGR